MAEVATVPSGSELSSLSRKRSASPSAEDFSTELPLTRSAASPDNGDLALQEPPAKKTKLIRRKRRPARPQVDSSTLKSEPPPQSGTIFNIWYNKWSGGDREDAHLSQTHALGRCNVKTDSGWTQADKVVGSYFCLFFARGICPKGHECEYLHRLPTIYDLYNPNIDCFGRDKHSDYRDDMGGVGSFMRQNRTLYVGRIHVTDDIEEVVARHFQEWGEIDRIRVLTGRGVAFVTYVNEANSQFAKEAMAHQSLDHEEILNVRWATTDPNPLSQKREAARIEEQAAEAVRRALGEKAVKQIEGRETAAEIAARKEEASFGLQGYEAPERIWYNKQKEFKDLGEDGGQKQLDRPPDTKLLEYDANQGQTQTSSREDETSQHSNGLLGGSTLAALQGFQASSNGKTGSSALPQSARPASTAPLVSYYGSDDESD